MCPECRRFICEEGCPLSIGRTPERGKPHLFCSHCRAPIAGGERFYSIGTRAFCVECLEQTDLDALVRLFRFQSHQDLLDALGAASRLAFSEGECL